jgi:phosphorylase/glycogen(starch) synthase
MSNVQSTQADYIFEVSWEVCNKVGGIHTVISTKAALLTKNYGDRFIMIGPDLYHGAQGNPEFTEDPELFKIWRDKSDLKGLKVRTGRWNIPGQPLVILVDYTALFERKNEIFAELWEKNKLDSLSGSWDYIEPALFGYAAGMVIECFMICNFEQNKKIIAQFHEWLTGAGVLYLENTLPEVATVFTTHATATGRLIAASGLPFYSNFEKYNGDKIATEYNIRSKHSLEKTAASTADCFTTVSENTAKECQQLLGKAVDLVTWNGFSESFLPDPKNAEDLRSQAKEKLVKVASSVLGYPVSVNSLLVATSGRYEFRNKGIDLFLKALKELNDKPDLTRDVIAFIMVPAANSGPVPEVVSAISTGDLKQSGGPRFTTHHLHTPEHDLIWRQIKSTGLTNEEHQRVKVIYAPIYLDGKDGIFNESYYNLLLGFDITAFLSYYEPFGYTPLESLAFQVPTITTSLTGFSQVVQSVSRENQGILIVDRSDYNEETVVDQVSNHVYTFAKKNHKQQEEARQQAFQLSTTISWNNLIGNYYKVYQLALKRFDQRAYKITRVIEKPPEAFIEPALNNEPIWKSLLVEFKIPESLRDLELLSRNLWWSWNPEAIDLFRSIDQSLWEQVEHNPICLLYAMSYDRFLQLENDRDFIDRLKAVSEDFNAYMSVGKSTEGPKVAYMCMEYGLHVSLPLYSGGLGILAGDFLKEASDQNLQIVGVGLLYRYGYFKQAISLNGEQVVHYDKLHFTKLPIQPVLDKNGERLVMNLPFRGPLVRVQVWKVEVGRIPLYLFDTDLPENSDDDKSITANLYGTGELYRLRQELLIGTCSLQLFDLLGFQPDLFHYNEGHTAFTGIGRILRLMAKDQLTFSEAIEIVRASSLFTTHTPVPAGHEKFGEDAMRSYQSHLEDELNIGWKTLLGFGKINKLDPTEKFSLTHFAARTCQEINAVSKIHEEVTKKMLQPLWKGFLTDELEIGHINNGVHFPTWAADPWKKLYAKLGLDNSIENADWLKILEVPDKDIWKIRRELKASFIYRLKQRLKRQLRLSDHHPGYLYEVANNLREDELIIGFARRFAPYKRADLLLRDLDRLAHIAGNNQKPVKFIFAGKAHPADGTGVKLIHKLVEVSKQPRFLDKIIFLPDYDMEIAELLVQGVDLWLNTPVRGMEASGTSGMKAMLNGVLNFSVVDGWWAEAYREDCGWALPREREYENDEDQNDLDAIMLYNILEHEIIPEFYQRNESDLPAKWVERIKKSLAYIIPDFSATRMLKNYCSNYYLPMFNRTKRLSDDNYQIVRQSVNWMQKIQRDWHRISVVDLQILENHKPRQLGEKLKVRVVLDLGGISPEDIGVEVVFAKRLADGTFRVKNTKALNQVNQQKHIVTYEGEAVLSNSGTYKYDLRFFPKSAMLHYRKDLPLVKWV